MRTAADSRLVTIYMAAPDTTPEVRGLTEVSRSYGITPEGMMLVPPATVFVPYAPPSSPSVPASSCGLRSVRCSPIRRSGCRVHKC
jgi:hypothetical protein